jgi:UrcA family protein
MRSTIRMFVCSTLAVAASSLAMAGDPVVTVKSEVVNYGDLRLISAVGAAQLYGRIRNAAERACGGPRDKQPLAMEARYRACVDEAITKAVDQVNQPVLTQFYETKKGASAAKAATPGPSSVANAR